MRCMICSPLRDLKRLAGQMRERREQQQWLAFAGVIVVMLGATL